MDRTMLTQRIEERARAMFRDGLVEEAAGLPEPRRSATPAGLELGGRWDGWRPLSLLPDAGLERVHWYFALLMGFLVARRRCADPELAEVYRKLLFLMFFGLALFGLLAQDDTTLREPWVEPLLAIEEAERHRRSLVRRLRDAKLGELHHGGCQKTVRGVAFR